MPQVSQESFEREEEEEEEDAMATAASREAMSDNFRCQGARSRIKLDAAIQRNARSETRYSMSSTDDDDDDDDAIRKCSIRSNESSRSSSSSGPSLDKYNEMIDQMIGLKFSEKTANDENGNARLEESRAETGKKKEGDDDDEDLVERGPVRPHTMTQSHHEKPYYTLNWLASSGQNIDNNNQLYVSDYECLSEIVQNKQLYEKLDPYIDKLSKEAQFDRSNYFINNGGQESNGNDFNDAIGEFQNVLELNNGAAVATAATGMPNENSSGGGNEASNGAIPVVTSDIGDSILEQLTKGAYQEAGSMYDAAAAAAAAAAVAGSSPHHRHHWPDSPASGWPHNENVPSVSSGSAHSRSSSRAQSPGSSVHVGSDIGGLQQYGPMGAGFCPQTGDMKNGAAAGMGFRVAQALSSSESSNHSFGDTSSPLSYESAIDHTAEQQLGFEFDSFSTGYPNYMSSDTLVNTAEIIDAIVDNEIQRVQQQVAEMAGQKDKLSKDEEQAAALSPPRSDEKDAVAAGTVATIATADSCNVYDVDAMAYAECMQINNFPNNDSFNNSAESFIDFNNTFENLLASRYDADSAAAIPAVINDSSSNLEKNGTIDYLANGSGISRADEVAAATTKISQSPFNEFQIPETVSAFRQQNHLRRYSARQRGGGRRAPWPCLNLPDTAASERLKAQLDPREVEKAMKDLLKRPREELAAADKDGDTMLMCLVGNGRELEKKKAYLVPLVERIGNIEGSLTMTNNRDEDALYIAAIYCPEMAYVTGYLAAAMLQKNIDIGKRLYRGGNNLVHVLAAKGDSHASVLAELLALETTAPPEGNVSVFDLCQRNYTGRTALQIAVESHDPSGPSRISCLGVTQLLLQNGADQRMQEITPLGNTALHTAVSLCRDPLLVKTLLLNKDAREVVNMPNGMNDTPVHLAFGLSTDAALSITAQIQICMDLIEAGGRTDLPNGQGKSPFALVSPDRRETMRNVFLNKKQDQEHLGFLLAGR